jgi:hypothetical protein
MASLVQIAIAARSSAAAALRAAERQVSSLGAATSRLSQRMFAQTRQVQIMQGAYRDANGQWRNANGQFIRQDQAIRIVTTRWGRLVNQIQQSNRALARYIILAGIAARVGGNVIRAVAPYALLAAKIFIVIAAITTLLGVTGNLLGATQLIAPAIIAAAAGMAVFRMALSGVADALKAGMSGDVEEFNKALKNLHPNAAEAVKTMLDLRREWKSTQQTVQGRFFAGFRDDIIGVSRALQPVAQTWLPKIADAFATARHALRYVFTEAAKSGQLDKIFAGVTKFFQGLMSAVAPLGRALLDVAEVAAGAFGDIGVGIGSAAQKFADWIRQMKENGKLQEWLDKAMHSLGQLKEIAGNVGEMLAAIFGAASDEGENFLEKLNRITQRMADWMNSSDGQELISNLATIVEMLAACEFAFKAVAAVAGFVYTVISNAWAGLKDIIQGVLNWILTGYELLLTGAAKAFGWIPGIGDKLRGAAKQFEEWKNQVNESLDGIKKSVDISVNYRARWIGNHLVRGGEQSGSYDGLGGRATGGPAAGSMFAGERGTEFIDFTKGMVYNSNQTKKFMAAIAGGGGPGSGNRPIAVSVSAHAPAGSMGAAVGALLNAALSSGQLKLKVDRSGNVVGAR